MQKSGEVILRDTHNVISLQESEDGAEPCILQDGLKTGKSGQGVAPASPSQTQENEGGQETKDTSGLKCSGSSGSVTLQSLLESRLRANLEGVGSPEYKLTWKHWDIPPHQPICALRASTPRTSGKGCGGWPTATTRDHKDGSAQSCQNVKDNALLGRVVHHTGHPPTIKNAKTGKPDAYRLNPRFSLWLMGYPIEWAYSGERVMR